jgi:hypothetical protein
LRTPAELGTTTGKLVVVLARENDIGTMPTKKWAHLYRYITGNVVGGKFTMAEALRMMAGNAKTRETVEEIRQLTRDIVSAGLYEASFYQYGSNSVWVGEEFKASFIDSLIKNNITD